MFGKLLYMGDRDGTKELNLFDQISRSNSVFYFLS